jgi:hypothetical protein
MNWLDKTWRSGWPLERVLFAMAGVVILLSIALVLAVSEWFLLLTAFVALNQLAYAAFGFCGTSLVLTRLTNLKPAISAEGTGDAS